MIRKTLKNKTVLTLALTIPIILGAASTVAQAEERIRWKMPSVFGTNLVGLGTPAADVAETLKNASGGAVEVRVYEPGEMVPAFDVLEAVASGKVPAGYSQPIFDSGSVPALPLFSSVPFGMGPLAYAAWYYEHDGQELLKQVYANKGFDVHPVLCGLTGPETAGWYSEPITALDDYKGMKIRFAGLGGEVIQKLGASVTMLPGGELFQALEKGTIDATEFSIPAVDQIIGFQQAVAHNLYPGWHQPSLVSYMLINGDEWKKVSNQHRTLIENVCAAAALRGLAKSEAKNGQVLTKFQDEGVELGMLPTPVLKELKNVTELVMQERAAENPDFKRVWEDQKQFIKEYKQWERRAYLPSEAADW